jgi:hypothetical protein
MPRNKATPVYEGVQLETHLPAGTELEQEGHQAHPEQE